MSRVNSIYVAANILKFKSILQTSNCPVNVPLKVLELNKVIKNLHSNLGVILRRYSLCHEINLERFQEVELIKMYLF